MKSTLAATISTQHVSRFSKLATDVKRANAKE